jgi:hypothetical protein
LGSTACDILGDCVVAELSWSTIAKKMNIDRKTARFWVTESIKLLARV